MFRFATVILLLAGSVLVIPVQGQTQDELVSSLVKKGDDLRIKSRESAKSAYLFALFFTKPDSPGAGQVRNKILSLGVVSAEVATSRPQSGDSGALLLPPDLLAFPKRTPESDLVNLRMLLDNRLLANLWYTRASPRANAFLFSYKPQLSMNEIRRTYGPPATEGKTVNGREVLTYGMFRIFGDSSGHASLVVFGQ